MKTDGSYLWHTFHDASLAPASKVRVAASDHDVFIATNVNAARLGPAGESPLLPFHGSEDIYVTKFSDTGLYQWHGYYGSADFDAIADIALTSTGTLAITGYAESPWLGANGAQPTTPFNTASFQEGVTLGLNASDGNYLESAQ